MTYILIGLGCVLGCGIGFGLGLLAACWSLRTVDLNPDEPFAFR